MRIDPDKLDLLISYNLNTNLVNINTYNTYLYRENDTGTVENR